jgi:hypothetical protein
MSFLFEFREGVCLPKEEVLLVEPFKGIWERDSSRAVKVFTFAELFTSKMKSNPYAGFDDSERGLRLNRDVWGDERRKVSDDEKECIKKLDEWQREGSATYRYYLSQLRAAEKLREFFMDFDMGERNERTGNPMYKPKEITGALADANKIIENLTGLRDKVEQELYEREKNRGNRETGLYEE